MSDFRSANYARRTALRAPTEKFKSDLPDQCKAVHLGPDELIFNDLVLLVSGWLQENPWRSLRARRDPELTLTDASSACALRAACEAQPLLICRLTCLLASASAPVYLVAGQRAAGSERLYVRDLVQPVDRAGIGVLRLPAKSYAPNQVRVVGRAEDRGAVGVYRDRGHARVDAL